MLATPLRAALRDLILGDECWTSAACPAARKAPTSAAPAKTLVPNPLTATSEQARRVESFEPACSSLAPASQHRDLGPDHRLIYRRHPVVAGLSESTDEPSTRGLRKGHKCAGLGHLAEPSTRPLHPELCSPCIPTVGASDARVWGKDHSGQ